ncbi:glutathione-dependent formaldehyde dehydrogenase [Planosporangium flavigriseum]|uniref:Glutathione-dependent formaldehyde dehydrogenase n=1 Tax=Planosporangium flavigriseum TaxID=373681 RepID=A0A8J3PML1_9ACTN|nr:zinc-dependent alcohol dehydrogenase [Planosporangium flavigriseum]NJC67591.1 glutathione-dependent formaldehyde dehydrogenase [Planosporangium flavigriseum]GIG75661.1 glutathione-dependent formaldehyde dehydrogenase [Planosporangium flavigriseum]
MKAICWEGVSEVAVEEVPDPQMYNKQDMIVKVKLSSVCGSDLHQLNGFIPTMRAGDVIGHEFLGEVVETGSEVRRHNVGDRVVVCSVIACGRCWFCEQGLFSDCDNSNTNPGIPEMMWGQSPAGIFGYSHAMGGFRGSHAEYTRIPFADYTAFTVPDGVDDATAVFASDSAPTGWMGADLGEVKQGDVVAVWGAGAVGQMAAQSAMLKGAARVIVMDRFDYRLDMAAHHLGVETLNYEETDIDAELRERSDGRGPDVCIEAVGLESHTPNPVAYRWEQVKQQTRVLEQDRPHSLRQAIISCRKGGMVYVLGVFVGMIDKFPMGALMNKGLTMRSAQQHGERYIPMLLERMARGEFKTAHLMTHPMPLSEGPRGYDLFKNKKDGCVRAVFHPDGDGRVTRE